MKKNYETIVIYRKDNEVIAVDKRNNKTAKAICSPKDTFDFLTGAKLAVARLDHHFKVGDIVIGNERANLNYGITKKGVKCRVVVDEHYSSLYHYNIMRVSPLNNPTARYTVRPECFDICLEPEIAVKECFKVGDYVVGTDEASLKYPITSKGVVCRVLNKHSDTNDTDKKYMQVLVVDTSSRFRGYKFYVCPEYFTLYDKAKGKEMEQNQPIKVGDKVTVINTGACYSCATDFVCENAPNNDIIARFAYGEGLGYLTGKKKLPNPFRVLAIKDDKAIIEDMLNNKVYVIGIEGLSNALL